MVHRFLHSSGLVFDRADVLYRVRTYFPDALETALSAMDTGRPFTLADAPNGGVETYTPIPDGPDSVLR